MFRKGGSRHAALDMGCETCHVTHKTGDRGRLEFAFHLTKAAPALCLDCHDPKDAELLKAHQDQPFGTRELPAVPRSAPVRAAQADAGVPAQSV